MGLKDCQIQLDNPWGTYYSGQTVNGNVRLTIDSSKTIRGMCINLVHDSLFFVVIFKNVDITCANTRDNFSMTMLPSLHAFNGTAAFCLFRIGNGTIRYL